MGFICTDFKKSVLMSIGKKTYITSWKEVYPHQQEQNNNSVKEIFNTFMVTILLEILN